MRCLFILTVFFLGLATHALADDSYQETVKKAEVMAQKIIDGCWAISEEDRSGPPVSVGSGTMNSALCMRDHINDLARTVLFKKQPDKQKEIAETLDKIIDDTGGFYGNLYTAHDVCAKQDCGSMWVAMPNDDVAKTMEKIVRDFYRQLAEWDSDYGFITSTP